MVGLALLFVTCTHQQGLSYKGHSPQSNLSPPKRTMGCGVGCNLLMCIASNWLPLPLLEGLAIHLSLEDNTSILPDQAPQALAMVAASSLPQMSRKVYVDPPMVKPHFQIMGFLATASTEHCSLHTCAPPTVINPTGGVTTSVDPHQATASTEHSSFHTCASGLHPLLLTLQGEWPTSMSTL